MMKWKKRALFFAITAIVISAAVAACAFLVPPLRKKERSTSGFWDYDENENYASTEPRTSHRICATEDCVLTAARILKYLDIHADPCADFYNYSCGDFRHSHSLPEGWDSYGSIDVINEGIDQKIKSILEQSVKVNESESLTRAKKVYETCMDTGNIEEHATEDLKDVLSKRGVGEWPFLNSEWNDCRLDIEWRMAKLNSLGLDSLFHVETQFRDEDQKLFAVVSVAPPLVDGICDEETDNMTIALDKASEHREVLESVLSLLGVEITNVTEQDIDELFEFDFHFCSVTKPSRENITENEKDAALNMTLLNLADMAPQINWIRWRNIIFSELRLNFPHDKQDIYVDGVEHSIEGINDLLYNSSSKVLANYLTWRFVFQHLGFLGKSFRQVLENHSQLLATKGRNMMMNSDRWIPRWRQCAMYVKQMMPMALLPEYGLQMRIYAREKEMHNVVSQIANVFRIILKDTRDLSPNEQMRSSHKIDLIQFPLTYPNKDNKFFEKYYSDIGLMGDSFLKNGLKLGTIRLRKLLEGVSRSKTIYDMEYAIHLIYSAFTSNTYSFFRGNQIVVSLGALDSYPIDRNLPRFLTLSTFGWTIGHELAHGFDLLALNGSSRFNWTWWPTYVTNFSKKRGQCYLDYSEHYKTKSLKKALETTPVNEDMCDHQGLYLAYKAYLRYLGHHGEDDTLPGIPLSNQKLFFVTYAQQFCEIRNSNSKGFQFQHSPGWIRVNQVLKNFAPFSETFRCPQGKPMNPRRKCHNMWILNSDDHTFGLS